MEDKIVNPNQRFALDDRGYVIDSLNPANSGKAYHHDRNDDRSPYDSHLRERVLFVRLCELVGKLIINQRPAEKDFLGHNYKPYNTEGGAISSAVFDAIRASHLNCRDPAISIEHKFAGRLKRQKNGRQDFTSISLFCDDVECLLRDLYGDIGGEALDNILQAVFRIVEEFTQFVRSDLWKEHRDAVAADYAGGIGVPEGSSISGSECGRGHSARKDLKARILDVRANPTAFSEYIVHFVNWLAEPEGSHSEASYREEMDLIPWD
jgi:hypothetical protein